MKTTNEKKNVESKPIPVQTRVFDKVIKEKKKVIIELLSGIEIHGVISKTDSWTIFFEETGMQEEQLIFKHAIQRIIL